MNSHADPTPGAFLHGVRIARISTVPFFVVTQLKHQIEAMTACGAQVTIVTSPGSELSQLHGMSGVTCTPIKMSRSISPWRDVLALFHLWRLFRREHFDIVHSTTPKAGLLSAIAAFMAGVPVRLHTFTGQPWIGMHGIRRWLARNSEKLIGLLNTHCYADSASQKQFLVEQGIADAGHLSVIGDGSLAGVDVQRFSSDRFTNEEQAALREALGITPDSPVLLFVGRITADKGVRELLEAFAALKDEGSSAHLVFVGPFDMGSGAGGGLSPDQVATIRDTHLVGYTESPERYMAIADILCLPSYREGFGTVVIEAAAMGVPTIGTDIYGLRDAIEDGRTGVLVAARDSEAISGGLKKLLSDDTLRLEMGRNARLRALERFASGQVNAGVIEEYRRLLRESV